MVVPERGEHTQGGKGVGMVSVFDDRRLRTIIDPEPFPRRAGDAHPPLTSSSNVALAIACSTISRVKGDANVSMKP